MAPSQAAEASKLRTLLNQEGQVAFALYSGNWRRALCTLKLPCEPHSTRFTLWSCTPQAQQATADLRALPQDSTSNPAAFGELFRLAGLVHHVGQAAGGLADFGQQAMWKQRVTWLHEELTALAAERLQYGEPEQYWSNVTQLLYEGALAGKAGSRQADLEDALAGRAQEVASLQERLALHESASTSTVGGQSDVAEVMELRTKLVVAQQEAQRRVADAHDTALRLQATIAERDSLRKQLVDVRDMEGRREAELAQLQGENHDVRQIVQQASELRAHNHMLSANLETHARVVERLIGLNTELMDNLNARAFGQPGDGAYGSVNQARSAQNVNSLAGEELQKIPYDSGLLPVSTNAANFEDTDLQHSDRRSISVHACGGALPSESITAAFEAFLQEDDAKRTNVELEFPGDGLAGSHICGPRLTAPSRGGLTGYLSKAVNLALYMAGNDNAVQQRAQDLGATCIL